MRRGGGGGGGGGEGAGNMDVLAALTLHSGKGSTRLE